MNETPTRIAPVLLAVLASLGGCGGPTLSGEEAACEYLKNGPAVALTSSPTATGMPPKVANDGKRYDVKLNDVPGGKGGYVTFVAPDAGDFTLFTGSSVGIQFRTGAGTLLTPKAPTGAAPMCDEVKGRQTFTLKKETHVIGLGPGMAMESLVIEAAQ